MRISYHLRHCNGINGQVKCIKAEEVDLNSKVTELRSKVSEMTEVPAHKLGMRHETPAITMLREAFPNKFQLNKKA